ncbi:MAG: shikimate dehydrogenase [Candidatus Rokuibacteriota bacterium]|nr:MAG: shikimate dehydrogenase [Candidatus Rokubacteria bacterium]
MLSGATRLVGLIGNPVAGSLSPRMQNTAFAVRGLDWAYVPLPVEAGRLEAAVGGLVALGFAGANVTAPYKTQVLAYCDEVDETAMRSGSVNTLLVRDGRVQGGTTDGEAVVRAVEARGTRALVLGAGGAAQAVATALVEAGAAELLVAARRLERGEALAGRLRSIFPRSSLRAVESWPAREPVDLIVNCTPIRDELVVELTSQHCVVDLAYRPDGRPTALVEQARATGCSSVVDGLEVLARQGALSFERWTDVPAPFDVMLASIRA